MFFKFSVFHSSQFNASLCSFIFLFIPQIVVSFSLSSSSQINDSLASRNEKTYIFHSIWLQTLVIVICLMISAYLTGLNIGLLSFDKYSLLLMIYSGTKAEKYHATKILPYLYKKHQTLITILIIKTFCESVFTLLLDNLVLQIVPPAISLIITAISSAMILLILGEIIPQSLFLKYSLQISSLTHYFIDSLWIITWIVAYPLSLVLDSILGEDQPKSSNQIFLLQEILHLVLNQSNIIHIRIILKALAIKSSIKSFINPNIQEIYNDENFDDANHLYNYVNTNDDLLKIYYSSKNVNFKKENIIKIELINPNLTFIQQKSLQISNHQDQYLDLVSFHENNNKNNNLPISNDNNHLNSSDIYESIKFIVVPHTISIAELMYRMNKSHSQICIVTQNITKSSEYKIRHHNIILGFINRSHFITALSKMHDNLKQDKFSSENSENNQTFDSLTNNINTNSSQTSYLSTNKAIYPFISKIAHQIAFSSKYFGQQKIKSIMNVLSTNVDCLQIHSVNSSGFSDESSILKYNHKSQFIIFTLHGYLPASFQQNHMNHDSSSKDHDNNNNEDNISVNDDDINNKSYNDDLMVYLPPFSLMGSEYISIIAKAINKLKINSNTGISDPNAYEELENLTYMPHFTMLLPKSSHYATFLKLDVHQIIQILI